MMFDFKFDWDKRLEIGIKEIDEQHQELFRIGRNIEQLIITNFKETKEEQLLEQLCHLRDYVTYHFYTEEELLKSTNAENFEEHKRHHDQFKSQIDTVNCIQLVEQPLEEFNKLKVALQEWLFKHIILEDSKMRMITSKC